MKLSEDEAKRFLSVFALCRRRNSSFSARGAAATNYTPGCIFS